MRTKFKDYSEFMNIKDCPECEGKGYYSVISCTKPISECCGGCFVEKTCKRCDGDKEVLQDDLLDFKIYIFRKNRFKREYDISYWKLSCGMSLDKLQRIILPDRKLMMHYWHQIKKK